MKRADYCEYNLKLFAYVYLRSLARRPYSVATSTLCRREINMRRGLQSTYRCPRLYPYIERYPSPHREIVDVRGGVVNRDKSAPMDTCFQHILSMPRQWRLDTSCRAYAIVSVLTKHRGGTIAFAR